MPLPEETASRLLLERGMTMSAAESCTGGLIAKRMTDLAGASRVFMGGVVSYTNAVKAAALMVPGALLDQFGAVSEPVARAMAEGCRRLCGSDLAVSVTGVAGPDRDDRGNPVGTVYIALASSGETVCLLCQLGEDQSRAAIRAAAADQAFQLVRQYLEGRPR